MKWADEQNRIDDERSPSGIFMLILTPQAYLSILLLDFLHELHNLSGVRSCSFHQLILLTYPSQPRFPKFPSFQ
jgi:hypothetical protein